MPGGGYRGTQGRKPKTSTIAERERQKDGAANPEEGKDRLPRAPGYLSESAKKEWRRLARQLKDSGLWQDVFSDSLAMYCVAHEQYEQALEMLNGPSGCCPNCDPAKKESHDEGTPNCRGSNHRGVEYGQIVRGRFGVPMKSPYISLKKEAETLMVRLNSEFGMTLASHSRIPGGKKNPEHRTSRPSMETKPSNDPREILKMQLQASKS